MSHSVTPEDHTSAVPSGTERVRAFLPTEDFDASKAFYVALGFTLVLEGDFAIFSTGESELILTRFYQQQYAENFMMQLLVDDLDAWWTRISSLNLPEHFGVPVHGSQQCSHGACGSPTSSTHAAYFGILQSAQPMAGLSSQRVSDLKHGEPGIPKHLLSPDPDRHEWGAAEPRDDPRPKPAPPVR